MILTYYFGRYEDEEFEYEVDLYDFKSYMLKDCLEDVEYAVKEFYADDTDAQKIAKEEYEIDSLEEVTLETDNGRDFIFDTFKYDLPNKYLELFEDSLKDFYAADAVEAYEDSKLSDWDRAGVSISDFL